MLNEKKIEVKETLITPITASVKMVKDPRFDTSPWESKPASASTSKAAAADEVADEEEEEQEEGLEVDLAEREEADDKLLRPLSKKELESFEKKEKRKGIIYISRIPYGMTVAKVRHLLSGFGDVDRIYLQDGREKERGEVNKKRNKTAHFTEGWVEFTDRKIAKVVAEMLNAEPIGAASGGSGGGGKGGGKKAGGLGTRRWRDEIWTMKYLSGFKWGMLSEQLANERASRASRVRAELSQSAFEQKDYLRKVERARVMREKEERRKAREAKQQQQQPSTSAGSVKEVSKRDQQPPTKERTFKQREAIVKDVREKRKSPQQHTNMDDTRQNKKQKSSNDDANSKALQGALSKIF